MCFFIAESQKNFFCLWTIFFKNLHQIFRFVVKKNRFHKKLMKTGCKF